jgi:anti-sigma B factor antagonist
MAGFTIDVDDVVPPVVRVTGELDMASAPELRDVLTPLVGDVEVDCLDLTFVDSSGIATLLRIHERHDGDGTKLVLRHLHGGPARVIEICGLDDVFHIVEAC